MSEAIRHDGSAARDAPVRHHPSETTLLTYASGGLAPLAGLVVATHVSFCPHCRVPVRVVERAGGLLLEDLPPASLAADTRERFFARLDAAVEPPAPVDGADSGWPPPLHGLRAGAYRWIGPGVHFAELARSGDALLGLLRLRSGVALPPHGHRGLELTCVLEGAYQDAARRFGPGDLEEADARISAHRPIACGPSDCVCLVATHGRLRFATVLSRLWQPLQPF